jgi:chromosome segregation ATPase
MTTTRSTRAELAQQVEHLRAEDARLRDEIVWMRERAERAEAQVELLKAKIGSDPDTYRRLEHQATTIKTLQDEVAQLRAQLANYERDWAARNLSTDRAPLSLPGKAE